MARRSPPPPTPKSPTLTIGQKRRRIERLQKCVTIRRRASEPLRFSRSKRLSTKPGYGTTAYLRYNQAATLDPGPLLAHALVRDPAQHSAVGPARHDSKAQETRQHYSDNKERSLVLLRQAIGTLKKKSPMRDPSWRRRKNQIPHRSLRQCGNPRPLGLQKFSRLSQGIGAASSPRGVA
jgi:hypothetical protein